MLTNSFSDYVAYVSTYSGLSSCPVDKSATCNFKDMSLEKDQAFPLLFPACSPGYSVMTELEAATSGHEVTWEERPLPPSARIPHRV